MFQDGSGGLPTYSPQTTRAPPREKAPLARLLAAHTVTAGPTRTTGGDKLAQRVLRSVSRGRHRSGLPTTGRSPWDLDGVTNSSPHGTGVTPAKPSPKEQAGNLHGRAQSGTFSSTRVRRGVLPAVGSAHPGDRVTHKRPEQPPERGRLPDATSFAFVRRLNPTAFDLRGPTRFTLSGFTYS